MSVPRTLVLLLLLASACAPAPPPSGSDGPYPGLVQRFVAFARGTSTDSKELVEQAVDTGDPRWVPFLLDLLRVQGDPGGTIVTALSHLTRLEAPADPTAAYVTFGTWMLDASPDPGSGYVPWKASLYGRIDTAFVPMLEQIADPVLASQLQWGGIPVGGIPELNDPRHIPAARATFVTPEELVFGTVLDGVARAYPLRILDVHELANDHIGDEPVALANCPLCRSGILFSRRVGDAVLDFRTSGLLLNSNKVMVDSQTGSLWQQLSGTALAGPLRGAQLDSHPLALTTWSTWLADHPHTEILDLPVRTDRAVAGGPTYEPGDAYGTYYASGGLWFPAPATPGALPPRTLVGTLELGEATLAVDLQALEDRGPTVLSVGATSVVAVPHGGGVRFYEGDPGAIPAGAVPGESQLTLPDGTALPRLSSGVSYWFAWYSIHPDGAWWPEG
jgi:hypothetical protein